MQFYNPELYPVLPPTVQRELLEKIRKGDEDALDRLVQSNMRFVYKIAFKYHRMYPKMLFDDLANEGLYGLIRSARIFDLGRTNNFLTYAVWWIRVYILRFILNNISIAKISYHHIAAYNKKQRKNNDKELTERDKLVASSMQSVDINKILGPSYESENNAEKDSLRKLIETQLLAVLTKKEQDILKRHYGYDDGVAISLRVLGEDYDISHERIRQIRNLAIKKIRDKFKGQFNLASMI